MLRARVDRSARKGEIALVFWTLLAFGLIAALANMIGGWWVVARGRAPLQAVKYLIAIGAGFMLAAVFLKVVPASFKQWEDLNHDYVPAMALLLAGYLFVQFFEHTIARHFHFGEETHGEAIIDGHAALTAVGGLAMHTFFDGVSIGSGFVINAQLGILIFIAIMLHKLPEGFTVASIMVASGRRIRGARWATGIVALATALGTISVGFLPHQVVNYTLPFSAGVTLYVAASDLIPEINNKNEGPLTSIVVFAGVALYYVSDRLIEKLYLG